MKLQHESAPAPSESRRVCDGIEWLRMPMPFALDHVNCWMLGEADDRLLIDTGIDDESTRTYWQTYLASESSAPRQMLVTHFHPDHIGLAGWFAELGCETFLGSEIETEIAQALYALPNDDYSQLYENWYEQHGLPAESIAPVRRYGNTYKAKVHKPPAMNLWRFLIDGQLVSLAGRQYEVIIGRGHAPEMIMLYRSDDHVLIAADQVLPSISPNISVMPRLQDDNPLNSFLHTLTRLENLPDDTLVLPSHGMPFTGLKERLAQLKQHHQQRLQQVFEACEQPKSAFELFPMLYRRKLDAQQTSFALGEALAHLHYLEQQGRLERSKNEALIRFFQP